MIYSNSQGGYSVRLPSGDQIQRSFLYTASIAVSFFVMLVISKSSADPLVILLKRGPVVTYNSYLIASVLASVVAPF